MSDGFQVGVQCVSDGCHTGVRWVVDGCQMAINRSRTGAMSELLSVGYGIRVRELGSRLGLGIGLGN